MNRHWQVVGFTLIELLVVIMVASILMALAAPNFTAIAKNNRIRSQVDDFHLSLLYARNEAIKRISRVTICASTDGGTCAAAPTTWEGGWITFIDLDNDATVDVGETILSTHETLTGGNTLRGDADVASYISYIGNGQTMKTDGTSQVGDINLCDDRGVNNGRAVTIVLTGRPSISQPATACP